MQNRLRQASLIIYGLKNTFGLKGYLYQPSSMIPNIETGDVVTVYNIKRINKAIVLPADLTRRYVFDLGYMAAAGAFTYGGLFDKELRIVFVDSKDIFGYVPTLNDYFVYNNKSYKIDGVHTNEDDTLYMLHLQNVAAADAVVVPEYTVRGSTKIADGDYNYHTEGVYKGATAYLWYDADTESWYISATVGNITGTHWGPNVEIQGVYAGTPNVTVVRVR